jgi:hypothetical protein
LEGADESVSLENLEKAIEAEVTINYYLRLLESSHDITLIVRQLSLEPSEIKDGQIMIDVPNRCISQNPTSPRERLNEVVSENIEIANYLRLFRTDSLSYHDKQQYEINRVYESIGLASN